MMNELNSILVEGKLVEDPQVNLSAKDPAVCSFTIASQRVLKVGEKFIKEISFFDVETSNKLAEVCGEYLKKGRGVRVVGRLKQERWKGKNGEDLSRVLILAEHVEFKPQVYKVPESEPESTLDGAKT